MQANTSSGLKLPRSSATFRTSGVVLGLFLATLALAALLVYSTFENINRAQVVMESFLRDKGETIIRSLEAGSMTYRMHHMGEDNPLQTFILENGKVEGIVFIRLSNLDGAILYETGDSSAVLKPEEQSHLLPSLHWHAQNVSDLGVYVMTRVFRLGPPVHTMPGMHAPPPDEQTVDPAAGEALISIGLETRQFEAARRQDKHHTLFMAALLSLVGSAGIYFLFLYHRMWLTKASLADMKLYADNVFASIPVGLVTLDRENRVVSCNRKTEEILGRSSESLLGAGLDEIFPDRPVFEGLCGDGLDHDAQCVGTNGGIVPVSINCSNLVNHDGGKIGKVLIIKDMRAIQEMEMQLERSRRMAALGRMAAGIAHEIRNPLGTLRGFAHFFGRQPGAGEEVKRYADLMVSEVDRLNTTVSGLLQFARPREPQMQLVKLDELLTKTAALMASDLAGRGLRFQCRTDTGIRCTGDPDLLLQVLMNLLKNSISATAEGGAISLTAVEDVQTVKLIVTDSGCGMNEQERERMFDPFFTTKNTGTGLGLTVSHRIIEQHKGVFEIRSATGAGTTITIILPKGHDDSCHGKTTGNHPAGR
jgi:two-component system sensor histidine kinase HydH